MKKQILLVLSLLAALLVGCTDQKATATRQRWMEIKTATDNLVDAMAFTNQSTAAESEDGLAEPLARATSTVNACQTFNNALTSQNTVNVDPRLNALAEKLVKSSEELLAQTRSVQEAFIKAQQLSKELETTTYAQKIEQISAEVADVIQVINLAQQNGAVVLGQINSNYEELESLRSELNKQYGFELPQITWMNQQ